MDKKMWWSPSAKDQEKHLATHPIYNGVKVDRSIYFNKVLVPEVPKKTALLRWTPDGIVYSGGKELRIELTGQPTSIRSYLFGLLFLYSVDRPLLENTDCPVVNEAIHVRVADGLFWLGGDGNNLSLEEAVREMEEIAGHRNRYVIQILDDDEETMYLFVDTIEEAASGLLAVPSDLELEMKEDVELGDCRFLKLEGVDFDKMFAAGSTWEAVIAAGTYKDYPLRNCLVDPSFSAVLHFSAEQ
jgi:hypothetical protein